MGKREGKRTSSVNLRFNGITICMEGSEGRLFELKIVDQMQERVGVI